MGFGKFFPSTSYEQPGGQAVNDMVGGLNNFNPWSFMPGIGRTGRMYGQDVKDFYGNKDVSQIKGLMPILSAIKSGASQNNALIDRSLTSGDAALANSGTLNAQRAQIQRQAGQETQNQMSQATAGYKQEAMGGLQNALNSQRGFGLQAAGLALGGKQAGLQGYLDSFEKKQNQGYGEFLGGVIKGGLSFL